MTLVILAAGLGSRYGGLKQIDPLGPNGEFIIDYSVYDAIRAGFDRVVFIIKEENLQDFRATIGERIERSVDVGYVFQDPNKLPGSVNADGRTKPWGTAHALWCCKGAVSDTFAIINADDFYGKESYRIAAEFLKATDVDSTDYAMIGFLLRNTLSESGTVARGLCKVENGYLTHIDERLKIKRCDDGVIRYLEDETWYDAGEDTVASMNFWAFTPRVFAGLENGWEKFVTRDGFDPMKSEYLLPTRVGELVEEKRCSVRVIPTTDTWRGVTYRDDREAMVEYLNGVIASGVYPAKLWH